MPSSLAKFRRTSRRRRWLVTCPGRGSPGRRRRTWIHAVVDRLRGTWRRSRFGLRHGERGARRAGTRQARRPISFAYGRRHGRDRAPEAAARGLGGAPASMADPGRARKGDGVRRPRHRSVRLVADHGVHRSGRAQLLRRAGDGPPGRLRADGRDHRPPRRGVVLGGASLYDVDLGQARSGIGYWLVPEARGRGAATHTVRLLSGWAFRELGLKRTELTCGPDNSASQRVAERCGFVREGVLRSHLVFKDGRRDSVIFSLLPAELR